MYAKTSEIVMASFLNLFLNMCVTADLISDLYVQESIQQRWARFTKTLN